MNAHIIHARNLNSLRKHNPHNEEMWISNCKGWDQWVKAKILAVWKDFQRKGQFYTKMEAKSLWLNFLTFLLKVLQSQYQISKIQLMFNLRRHLYQSWAIHKCKITLHLILSKKLLISSQKFDNLWIQISLKKLIHWTLKIKWTIKL